MDISGISAGFDLDDAEPAPASDIVRDERRMHVRAYHYWASLLGGRDFPSIADLDPASVSAFAAHSVLLDFTGGGTNPGIRYVGTEIRGECGLGGDVRSVADVPAGSLLSRLTDRFLQIIANRAPVGYEAEFVDHAGRPTRYRGILMPFSSNGESIDFIYGVINWKKEAAAEVPAEPIQPELAPVEAEPALRLTLDEDAGLADHLGIARDSAERCRLLDGRSRAALYQTLALAYDFAVASHRAPDDYAEILEDAGVREQARAPMTAVTKLVFGVDYDRARLTEFAAALSFAERSGVDFGGFAEFIEGPGLKGLVAAERAARRPAAAPDRAEAARAALRERPAVALEGLSSDEFALVLTRRADGTREVIGMIADPAMLERAIRKLV